MNFKKPELLAAYWTLAGDVFPAAPTEVSPYPLQDRAAAAAKVGYTGMGLVHQDLVFYAKKIGYSGIRRILDDNGIKHVEVEFLNDWYLDPHPGSQGIGQGSRRTDGERCGTEGAQLQDFPSPLRRQPAGRPADARRILAAVRASARGRTNVLMEMMPFTNVKTIDTAMAIIAGANEPNGGILLDIWHVARGGMDYSEIAKIPAQFLKGVELDDADSNVVGTLFEDTRFRRRLCGGWRLRCAVVPSRRACRRF